MHTVMLSLITASNEWTTGSISIFRHAKRYTAKIVYGYDDTHARDIGSCILIFTRGTATSQNRAETGTRPRRVNCYLVLLTPM